LERTVESGTGVGRFKDHLTIRYTLASEALKNLNVKQLRLKF